MNKVFGEIPVEQRSQRRNNKTNSKTCYSLSQRWLKLEKIIWPSFTSRKSKIVRLTLAIIYTLV